MSSDHFRIPVLTCIDFVIKEVEKHTALKKVVLWSDIYAAQLSSRFALKLTSSYRPYFLINWHYNKTHHSKDSIDGAGGTIKNLVFRRLKLRQTIINLAEDFCKAANQFIPSITMLFQIWDVVLNEPYDIEEAPIIPGTLTIRRFTQCPPTATGETQINFFFLLNSKELCCTRKNASKKSCEHVDCDFDFLTQCRSMWTYCMEKDMGAAENQDW